MIKGEPKWWKIMLKEPASWLIWLTLLGALGSFVVGSLIDRDIEAEPTESKIESSDEK